MGGGVVGGSISSDELVVDSFASLTFRSRAIAPNKPPDSVSFLAEAHSVGSQ